MLAAVRADDDDDDFVCDASCFCRSHNPELIVHDLRPVVDVDDDESDWDCNDDNEIHPPLSFDRELGTMYNPILVD